MGKLVLSRYRNESIIIGDDIVITVVDIRDNKCRLEINAPIAIPVYRQEVYEAIQREKRNALALAENLLKTPLKPEENPPAPILMKGDKDVGPDPKEE